MTLRIVAAGAASGFGPEWARSHLDDGRVVLWRSAGPATAGPRAIDAERFDRPGRAAIARRLGWPEDGLGFALHWTRAEVRAKLAGMPILEWLRAPVALDVRVVSRRLAAEPVVVSVGSASGDCLVIPGIPIDGGSDPSGKVWGTGNGGLPGSIGASRG